ncbi:uncharacterized protein LOC118800141 [Colossoma macropomum]|uniref:uncharacterized protein LOC118800141 n=1 Tax=Colossoma macropomum TaxID=42526 RepID=UPI0018652F3E|nr:uncharacterized protein LOC118800141 [Colossoma macropomum]
MKLLLLMSLLLYNSIHTAQTVIFSQSETEGRDVSLVCVNASKVIWSKGTDGGRSAILSAESGEITQKHRPDPENRYSVLTDSSLVIKSVSLSDSGIYYCNSAPVVNLTVNPAASTASPTTTGASPSSSTKDYIIATAVLVGVLLIVLALFLQRRYCKREAANVTKADHVCETINDAAPTTQPASAPPKEGEDLYMLAGDPDIIKLGLKNQSAASPLVPQVQFTENNPSEPLYSTISKKSTRVE